jgi:hypothetical protein
MRLFLVGLVLIVSFSSSVFAHSRACKTAIKTLYRKYAVEIQLIEEAKSRCELKSIEMQICLTGDKFYVNDKTPAGIRELFSICDADYQNQIDNIYFN